jgi:hypothetical protein
MKPLLHTGYAAHNDTSKQTMAMAQASAGVTCLAGLHVAMYDVLPITMQLPVVVAKVNDTGVAVAQPVAV